jgi:hypothetical protein
MGLLRRLLALLLLAAADTASEGSADGALLRVGSSSLCSMIIAVAPDAPEPERAAAAELAALAGDMCGGALDITFPANASGRPQLAVGTGAAMAVGIAPADLHASVLGEDGFVASSNRSATLRATGSFALSGAANSTTGSLYACYHFLRALGVRCEIRRPF